jgi:hypothetical protein
MLIKSKHSGFLSDGTRTPFLGGGSGGILSPVTNLLFGKPPAPPPPPDYRGAAQETAAGNLAAAQSATAANRVNQITPYGNLNYAETGVDSRGNPTWTATQTLSPAQQQLLDIQNQTSAGLGSAINAQLGQVQNVMGQGFNPNIPQTQTDLGSQFVTDPNYASGMQGWDRANQILQARLGPKMEQQSSAQAARLANQGIVQGTKAYENAMRTFNQGQNDLLTNSQLAGQQIGQNLFTQGLQGGQFTNQSLINRGNFGNQAQQQAFNQALTRYNLPLNTLSSLRTGAQVQNPSFVNAPQQATTGGADMLGATGMNFNAQLGGYNAQAAERNNMMQGLFSLGGAAMLSDIRTKENIKQIHWMPNGLPVYEYEYKPEFKDHSLAGHGKFVGVMAQEVEQMYPQAVTTLDNGYKAVNYGLLP